MPNLSVLDKVLVTLKGTFVGQTTMTTFPLVVTSMSGATTISIAANALYTKFVAANQLIQRYLGCMSDQYTLDEMWFQVLWPTRYRKVVIPSGLPGTIDGLVGTANVAAVISRFGDAANRHNMGSIHLPIPTNDQTITGGSIIADFKVKALALANTMDVTLGGNRTLGNPTNKRNSTFVLKVKGVVLGSAVAVS